MLGYLSAQVGWFPAEADGVYVKNPPPFLNSRLPSQISDKFKYRVVKFHEFTRYSDGPHLKVIFGL